MVRDVIVAALNMLGMENEAKEVSSESGEISDVASRFLRFYNLVVSEIADEYRRDEYPSAPVASSLDDGEATFTGISNRVLAYGVAAEYCITEGSDDAVTWDERYKAALSLAKRPSLRLKARRFY